MKGIPKGNEPGWPYAGFLPRGGGAQLRIDSEIWFVRFSTLSGSVSLYRQSDVSRLKLELTIRYQQSLANHNQQLNSAYDKLITSLVNSKETLELTLLEDLRCYICHHELRLQRSLLYRCAQGHCFQSCSQTLLPIGPRSYRQCSQCGAVSNLSSSANASDQCCYCGSQLLLLVD